VAGGLCRGDRPHSRLLIRPAQRGGCALRRSRCHAFDPSNMSAETWTVGRLARRFGLARSTLLYYDTIGLLSPRGRSAGNYRLYGEGDVERLERICRYRAAGVPLEAIAGILSREGDGLRGVLEQRLFAIDREIRGLREQRALILRLLESESADWSGSIVTKETWVEMLRTAGLDEAGMRRWHREFERVAPEAHDGFLSSLGIAPSEIAAIRAWSRAADEGGSVDDRS
jgi:MerR family transcriptional regulator, thiopeptide resistance regulator